MPLFDSDLKEDHSGKIEQHRRKERQEHPGKPNGHSISCKGRDEPEDEKEPPGHDEQGDECDDLVGSRAYCDDFTSREM